MTESRTCGPCGDRGPQTCTYSSIHPARLSKVASYRRPGDATLQKYAAWVGSRSSNGISRGTGVIESAASVHIGRLGHQVHRGRGSRPSSTSSQSCPASWPRHGNGSDARIAHQTTTSDLLVVRNDDWFKDCEIWLYRGAWQEWEPEQIEMAVPLSPDEIKRKKLAIFRHESQKDAAL